MKSSRRQVQPSSMQDEVGLRGQEGEDAATMSNRGERKSFFILKHTHIIGQEA